MNRKSKVEPVQQAEPFEEVFFDQPYQEAPKNTIRVELDVKVSWEPLNPVNWKGGRDLELSWMGAWMFFYKRYHLYSVTGKEFSCAAMDDPEFFTKLIHDLSPRLDATGLFDSAPEYPIF